MKALGVDADTNDGVRGDVEAKNEDVLGTKVPADGLAFIVAMEPEWCVQWDAPPNGGRRSAQRRGTGGPEFDVRDMGGRGGGLGMRVQNNTQGSVGDWASLQIVPESWR